MTNPAPPPLPAAPRGEGAAFADRDPRRPFAVSPFSRLARTHAFSIAGDAVFAIGLAGSVFFSLDFNSARWRVALYLVLTIAPFAVAAPIIGPAIDRIKGGRRWIIVGSVAVRALLCFFVVRHLDSILFYPEAFLMLVMGKVYTISKSAVVPATVRSDEELVEANSKLTVLSAIAVVVAVVPAGLLLKLGGARWTVGFAGIVFLVATVLAFRLQPTRVAVEPAGEAEREELRSAGILQASSAMGLFRGIVGFLSFMLAFDFKNSGAPLWELGFVAGAAQLGFFAGAVLAPRLRRVGTEENILIGTLVATMLAAITTAFIGGLAGAAILSAMVGATGSAAKQAFDSIVQRDAPDANRGRSFARFETRFQLVWVIGALIPIVVPIPAEIGFLIIALVAAVAVVNYLLALRRIRSGRLPPRRRGLLRRPVPPDDDAPKDGGVVAMPGAPPLASAGSDQVPDPTLVSQPPPPPPPAGARVFGSDPSAAEGRRWVRPPATDWQPPPGFVSSPLESYPAPSQPRPSSSVTDVGTGQLALPLEPSVSVPSPEDPPTSGYPDPPWRDAVDDPTTVLPADSDSP